MSDPARAPATDSHPPPSPEAEPRRFAVKRLLGWVAIGTALTVIAFAALGGRGGAIPGAGALGHGSITWSENLASVVPEAQASNRPLLLYFTAGWCEPCQRMEEEVFSRPEIKAALETRFEPVLLDSTRRGGASRPVAIRFAIQAYPTFVACTAEGRELSRIEGARDAAEFLAWLDRAAEAFARKSYP